MPIIWGVTPAEPEIQGFREWFQQEGINIPAEKGRYPTLNELIEILEGFGQPISRLDYSEELIEFIIGAPRTSEYAAILGSIHSAGYYHFHFFDNESDAMTMIKILKKLSVFCGPLVLWEPLIATPIVITPQTDLEQALNDWHERFRNKLPAN